ncbi:MAG: PAS domain S-box protein [Saprospiraceae bacterium]|nr:PAS domain S-box protein [Saprospiraceae bacterium]
MLVINQLQEKIIKILSRNSSSYDVFDFRVGTLIGTSTLLLIPIVNMYFLRPIPDLPLLRNCQIVIQLLSILASYHIIFVKKWANEIGNLFSIAYAVLISTAAYNNNFQPIETVFTLGFLVGITGMFKSRKAMTLYTTLVLFYFISLVWLCGIDAHSKKFITLVALMILSVGYYIFFVKLDYVRRLKNRENELRKSESWFRNIFDNSPVGIVMLDENYHPFKFNKHFQKITGYTEGELLTMSLKNLIHPDDYIPSENLKELIKNNNTYLEQRLLQKSGNYFWVRLTLSQMIVENELFTISMFNDISVERQASLQLQESTRQLKAQNESLEEFSYVISHDLKEPLRMITSFSQFIYSRYIKPLNSEDAKKDFEFVVDGAKRMNTLITDMHEYTKWSGQALPIETVNVREVLLETMQNLTVAINRSQAVVTASNLPIMQVNRRMLVQVFQNLISNAIKYRSPLRTPEIAISVLNSGSEWIFSFKDNGIGFDNKHKERVFGIFQRLNNDRVLGNGIGLAICKRIIEKQGGRIWAESEVNVGSTFSFSIPIREENPSDTEGVLQDDLAIAE